MSVPGELNDVVLQDSELTDTGAALGVRDRTADTDDPFKAAVSVAVWGEVIAPAVTVKLALLLPAATVTEAGTDKLLELDCSRTAVPPVPAGLLRPTVQMSVPGELNDVVLQDSRLTDTGAPWVTVIVPPEEVTGTLLPFRSAAMAFDMPITALVALLVNVVAITATTPSEMVLELIP
jgi:hypothetical protein